MNSSEEIEDSMSTILKSIGLNQSVQALLLNPLTKDIDDNKGLNAVTRDVCRIKNNIGTLLQLQYTNDISLLTPFCLNVLYQADNDDVRTLLNMTQRKNKLVNGDIFFNMVNDLNSTSTHALKTTTDNLKHKKHAKKWIHVAKTTLPNLYSSEQWVRTVEWSSIHMSQAKFNEYLPNHIDNIDWILSRVNELFNQYLVKTGYLAVNDSDEYEPLLITEKGTDLANLTDYQIKDYVKKHPLSFKSRGSLVKIFCNVRDVFQGMKKHFDFNDYYGLGVASILCDTNDYFKNITYKDENYTIALDKFVYLSCVLILLNNLVDNFSIKPSKANVSLINHLRSLSNVIQDFYHYLDNQDKNKKVN